MQLRTRAEKQVRSLDGDVRARESRPRLAPPSRRRSLPWLLLGILLVAGSALAFAVTSSRLSSRQPVLALAQDVPAGHVLESGDLSVVNVGADATLGLIPASSESSVLGRPAAMPLVAGSLLTDAELGGGVTPPFGTAVVGVALKSGQFPPEIAPGDHVLVVMAGGDGLTVGAAGRAAARTVEPISAMVVGVHAASVDSSAASVVSLQLAEGSAPSVALGSAQGTVSLILVSGEGGS
jgi:hypothetical protein